MDVEERAHGDGIFVNYESPEALEEVFWRVFCGPDYIRDDRLIPMTIDSEIAAKFRDYVSLLLLQHQAKCYLSKNNNNTLRLHSLTKCFPRAIVLISFREPLQQAYSLLSQHQRFTELHRSEPFSRDYMNWLVHHEFGLDHKPFVFDETRFEEERSRNSSGQLNYWLQMWIDTYEYIDSTAPEGCIFLSYEQLCDNAETVWPQLCARIDIPLCEPPEPLRRSHRAFEIDPNDLHERAAALYQKLRNRENWC